MELRIRPTDTVLTAALIQECLETDGDEASFCALMRRHVRRLVDFSCAAVLLESASTPAPSRLLVRIDMPPRFLRALCLTGRLLRYSDFLRRTEMSDPLVLDGSILRGAALGPRLRPLALGRVALHRHVDPLLGIRSAFVYVGVSRCSEETAAILLGITPYLHLALLRAQRARLCGHGALTAAERDVVQLLLAYKTNKEIARLLGKSDSTVRNQLHAAFRKLEVKTRAAAIAKLRSIDDAGIATETSSRSSGIVRSFY